MARTHIAEFDGRARSTGNSLAVTIPEWIVKREGVAEGDLLEIAVNRPSIILHIQPSWREKSMMGLSYDVYERYQPYLPDAGKAFRIEIDGETDSFHITRSLTISGFGPFYKRHPMLTRVRLRVLKRKEAFRIEFEEAWTD